MSRSVLSAVILLAGTLLSLNTAAQASSPHMNPSLQTGGCRSCHSGHGRSGSPMMPESQRVVCFRCHGSNADVQAMVGSGMLSANANPRLMESTFALPYSHPVSDFAFSRYETGAVACSSCHSPHRGSTQAVQQSQRGEQKPSTLDVNLFEYELCMTCHGMGGSTTQDLTDISRLFSPQSRSFHPVIVPTTDDSPSVDPDLRDRYVNCTDCHGNNNPDSPKGPHGSLVQYLLNADYSTADTAESEKAYKLCYTCHQRDSILEKSPFPGHGRHIVKYQTSCATCHNPHGSVNNRAMIRFGEETTLAGVTPSISTGRLGFESRVAGTGLCYLTCHGVDHGPLGYGNFESMSVHQTQPPNQISHPQQPVRHSDRQR